MRAKAPGGIEERRGLGVICGMRPDDIANLESRLQAVGKLLTEGKVEAATEAAFAALVAAERLGDLGLLCDARIQFAHALGLAGDHASAIFHFQAALPVAKQLNDEARRAKVLEGLGTAYLALDGFEEALDTFRSAAEAAQRTKLNDTRAIALGRLARTWSRWGVYAERNGKPAVARRRYAKCLEVAEVNAAWVYRHAGPVACAIYRSNHALAFLQNGRFKEALVLLRRNLKSDAVKGNPRRLAATFATWGHLEIKRDNPGSAVVYLETAVGMLEKGGLRDLLVDVRDLMANAYEANGDLKLALEERRKQILLIRLLGNQVLATRVRLAKMERELTRSRATTRKLVARAQALDEEAGRWRRSAGSWREKASIDPLTGLNSRRVLEDLLAADGAGAGKARAVIMLDIDHFKKVNDTFGHQVGDVVLAQVAQAVLSVLGAGDTAFRSGGEEMIVLPKSAARQRAIDLASAIRAAVEARDWESMHNALRVTASVGIAATRGPLSEVIEAADGALYRAKRGGRNRVEIA